MFLPKVDDPLDFFMNKYPQGQFPSFDLVTKIAGKPILNRYEPLPEKSSKHC
jgi:hypothetical protein